MLLRLFCYSRLLLLPVIFIPQLLAAQGNSKARADSALLDPIIKKANASLGKPKVADSLALYAFKKAKALKNDDYSGRAAAILFASAALADVNKSLSWYDTSMVFLNKAKNHLWIGYNNINMGIRLTQKYKFEKGIAYLLTASKNFEQAKDTAMISAVYTTIANAFHDFGNYESGKKYAKMSIAVLKIANKSTPALRWRSLSVLAINYDDNNELDSALSVHFTNLKNAEGNPVFLGSSYNNIGNTYQKKRDFDKANRYLLLAIQKGDNSNYHYSAVYSNLANVNMELGNLKIARKYIDSALYHSVKSGRPEKLIDTYENLYKLGVKTNNYKEAFKYLKKRADLKDSLFNVSKTEILYDLQVQYETEKKDKENQQLKYQSNLRATARDKAEHDKLFAIYTAIIVIIALCIIFGLIYRNTIVKTRFAEEQKLNKALFEGEQKERIRIARDLHDSIGQMLSVIKMNVSGIPENKTSIATLELVDSTITEVRNISHNLIPEELNFGLFTALEDMCDKINRAHTTQVVMIVPDEVRGHEFEKTNELSIYRIVQEVLNNMVKHSQASQIKLEVARQGTGFNLTIKDNGKGFDIAQINRSNGLGWKNIAARVNMLDGKMQVRSEQLTGTQIEITIPGA